MTRTSASSAGPPAGLSIRYSLPLLIGTLVAAVLAIYAAAAYHEVRESAVEAAGARLTTVTGQLAGLLAGNAAGSRPQIVTAAADPALVAFLADPASADSAAAVAALSRGTTNFGGELRDVTMRRVLASRDDLPVGTEPDSRLASVLERSAAGAIGEMRTVGDSLVAPVAAPVLSDGRTIGYLVTWGRIAAGGLSTVEQLVGADARMYIANAGGDVWMNLNRPVPAPPLDLAAAAGGYIEYSRDDRTTWLAAGQPIDGVPWVVVVELPHASVIAQARGMLRTFILLGLLALLLAAAATWALAGRFTAPILQLARTARSFSAGDYASRSPVARRDEIGALSTAFNTMADNVAGAHGTLQQKLNELALLESQHRAVGDRLRQVLASSPDVIYEMMETPDGPAFTWVSENVERLIGATDDDVRTPGWWAAHVHPDDAAASSPPARDGAADGDVTRDYRLLHRDGTYRWIRDRVRQGNGSGRVVGAWSDVTELRSLEEQFRQAQKLEAVGRLAGGIAHDFNNIVTVILGETEMALSTIETASHLHGSLEEVRTAAERASLLTRQLLTFSRKQLTETTIVNLNDVVHGVRGMLGRLIGEDLDMRFNLAAALHNVRVDRAQIEQVLLNLVINARDAMPDGGIVVIETQNVTLEDDYVRSHPTVTPGDYVALVVSDTGTGMSAEVRAHLFEPFFTTKGAGKGTGLGLATCYGIARQFGGHIGVYSEVDVGTTVKLYLPRTSEPERRAHSATTPAAVPSGTESILLVEDEAQVRAIVARMLGAQGYRVTVAANGNDALEILERGDVVDLLLTDLVMPRMGGRELAERAAVLRPELRVLFTSGYTEDVIMQNRLLEHDIVLLNKPFTRLELASKVREVLDTRLLRA